MPRPCRVGIQLPEVERRVEWPELFSMARTAVVQPSPGESENAVGLLRLGQLRGWPDSACAIVPGSL